MKKIITIILLTISMNAEAQFKSNAEANKYKTLLKVDSDYNSSAKGRREKASGVYLFFIYQWKDTITGKIIPIQYTLWKNGLWTEKLIKK